MPRIHFLSPIYCLKSSLSPFSLHLRLFIMRPHPNDLHRFDIIQNLVNRPVLDRDPAGTCAGEISRQLLVWRRTLVRIFLRISRRCSTCGFKPALAIFFASFLACLVKTSRHVTTEASRRTPRQGS